MVAHPLPRVSCGLLSLHPACPHGCPATQTFFKDSVRTSYGRNARMLTPLKSQDEDLCWQNRPFVLAFILSFDHLHKPTPVAAGAAKVIKEKKTFVLESGIRHGTVECLLDEQCDLGKFIACFRGVYSASLHCACMTGGCPANTWRCGGDSSGIFFAAAYGLDEPLRAIILRRQAAGQCATPIRFLCCPRTSLGVAMSLGLPDLHQTGR